MAVTCRNRRFHVTTLPLSRLHQLGEDEGLELAAAHDAGDAGEVGAFRALINSQAC